MADITLHTSNDAGVTCVSNAFIDEYMKDANGEFVKIYLYLLRLLGQDELDIDISVLAEKLDHTERDVKRALNYWEKCKLLSLEYNSNNELTGICFLEPSGSSNTVSSQIGDTESNNTPSRSPMESIIRITILVREGLILISLLRILKLQMSSRLK